MKINIRLLTLFFLFIFHLQAVQATAPIVLSGKSNVVIDGQSFTTGLNGVSISLVNCTNVKIVNCSFLLNSGVIGIQMQNCSKVEISGNNFKNFRTGIYAIKCTGGIDIHCNSFKDIAGIYPRGQIVQFNNCTGAGNRVNYNILDHTFGTGNPEDLINMYASSGTTSDPIQIVGNNLRGGGPSKSGGGIMVGDDGGHDILVADNILVDPGQYGIGVPAGYNITLRNNKVFGKQQSFTNVGIYVGLSGEIAAGFACTGSTIRLEGNQVNWTNKDGVKNGRYFCTCCPGIVLLNNNFGATFTSSILPAVLSLNSTNCGVPTVANKLPTVSLTSPLSGSTFTAPASISIAANATDLDGSISKVEFYNGSTLLTSDITAPYSYNWTNVAAGNYSITAKATDNAGGVTISSITTITVKAAVISNKLPSITITSPLVNAIYTAPASVSLSANASDADGTISKVEFYNGTTLLNTDAVAPYTFSWNSVTAGVYSVSAKVYDNLNAFATSSPITITVKASVVGTTAGISGLSCISAGQTYSYSVVTESSNYSTINFWSNTGAVIVQDVLDKRKMTIQIPSYMNGTSFTLYSGVNYNVSPWYKEYTKTIKVGGCSAKVNATVSPQPTETISTVSLEEDQTIRSVIIFNSLGVEVHRAEQINQNQVELGEGLATGMYTVIITTDEGTTTTRMMKK